MVSVAIASAIGKVLVLMGLGSAAVWDLSKRTVPNTLVLMVGGGGLLRLAAAERYAAVVSIAAAGILFVLLRLLANFGMLGGGDAKLIAVVTLGQPPASILPMLLSIALAGGILAIVYLIRDWVGNRDGGHRTAMPFWHAEMPYVPAILAGLVWHQLWAS